MLASPDSLPSSPYPRKCVRGLLTPLGALLFLLFSLLRPFFFFFMAMLLMVHIFQSNMFRIRPHNEVTTPSCAAPTQGSLPYIWSVHIWLRLTAGQMLHPSAPRPAASSARDWSCTHAPPPPPPCVWSTEGLRSSGSPRGAWPLCDYSSCAVVGQAGCWDTSVEVCKYQVPPLPAQTG